MMRFAVWFPSLSFVVLAGLFQAAAAVAADTRPTVTGWPGFYPKERVTASWLSERGINVLPETVQSVFPRLGKLILAEGSGSMDAEQVHFRREHYCQDPFTRAWNDDLCRALGRGHKAARMERYERFGNCSAFFFGGGHVLTAAHGLGMTSNPAALVANSALVQVGSDGRPGQRFPLEGTKLGKRDFSHDFVSKDEAAPLDVARIAGDDGALPRWPIGPVPPVGAVVFVAGFPRVERRPESERQRVGYTLSFGTPVVAFGRVADRNEAGWPLCSLDGDQAHWALAPAMPAERVETGEVSGWRGVIQEAPFLASFDTCNGLSGAPVFDTRGRLVGINSTIIADTDPQERYVPETRAVVVPIARALSKLGL